MIRNEQWGNYRNRADKRADPNVNHDVCLSVLGHKMVDEYCYSSKNNNSIKKKTYNVNRSNYLVLHTEMKTKGLKEEIKRQQTWFSGEDPHFCNRFDLSLLRGMQYNSCGPHHTECTAKDAKYVKFLS